MIFFILIGIFAQCVYYLCINKLVYLLYVFLGESSSPRLDSPLMLLQPRGGGGGGFRRGVSPLSAPYSPLSPLHHHPAETDSGVDSLLTSLSDSSSNYSHYRNLSPYTINTGVDPSRGRPIS